MTSHTDSPVSEETTTPDVEDPSPSSDTVLIAPKGSALHRPSPSGEGTACAAIATTWHQREFTVELATRYDPCQREECAAYIDKLEPTGGNPADPPDTPPAWLRDVETPVVETSGGKVLHRPDPAADKPATVCNTEIRANEWRVRDLTARYAVFHRPCACDPCSDYMTTLFNDLGVSTE